MHRIISTEGSLKFSFLDQTLWLLPQKAVFWHDKKILILADLHLGKAGHFRKSGIPIPATIHQEDLTVLDSLIHHYQPEKVLILGDLFHSVYNNEWKDFVRFLSSNADIPFILVKGNHDILPTETYEASNLHVVENKFTMAPFCFSHQPVFSTPSLQNNSSPSENSPNPSFYNLCGHIHPGIKLRDPLGHSYKIPCFYFSKKGGILPAFGKFTGLKCLKKTSLDLIFGVAEISDSQKKVFKVA